MIDLRPFAGLGRFRNDWLNARHHFSFGEYHDPERMGFGPLRVWNDDEIAPQRGFDPHPHREMEIITYVRAGAITHKDSLGNEGRTEAGDVQVMHAGTGIVHAEYNRETVPTRLFQIWVMPNRRAVTPGWGTRQFPSEGGGLRVLASGRAAHDGLGALPLHADAAVLAGRLGAGEIFHHRLPEGGGAYIVVASGTITVNSGARGTRAGETLGPRDGAAISGESEITITGGEAAEIVLVELGQ